MEGVNPAAGKPAADAMHVKTSNLSFNNNTGEASTPAPVEFEFSGGKGSGVGITYSSSDSTVRVEHGIQFEMAASDRTGGIPVTATGSSLTVRRNDRVVVLDGPARCGKGSANFPRGNFRSNSTKTFMRSAFSIEGSPKFAPPREKENSPLRRRNSKGLINPAGWVQRIVADGKVAGTRQTAAGTDRFQAAHAEFAMVPEQNLLKDMTATGGVTGARIRARIRAS